MSETPVQQPPAPRLGPIAAARARQAERAAAIVRDARRATMEPGPGTR